MEPTLNQPAPVAPPPRKKRSVNLHLVLTVFLALGMLLFGALAVIAYRDNTNIHATLDERTNKAAVAAAAVQKQTDTDDNRKANELPYRVFTADQVDGGFQLQIPKNWSIYYSRSTTGNTPVDISINPDMVIKNTGAGALNTQAFKLQVVRRSQQEIVKGFDSQLKLKKLTSRSVTVSGISGTLLEGTIDEQRHSGQVIVIPVRDKTMILTTEDRKYLDEFTKIVGSATIVP